MQSCKPRPAYPATRAIAKILVSVATALVLSACDGPRLTPLPPGATVLAFGDSLTYGTGTSRDKAYPAVLANLTGLRVINAGVPGEVTAAGLKRLPGLLAEHRPTLVILTHGGNDTLRKLSPEQTAGNLRAMLALARDAGAQVVMLGVPGKNLTLSAPDYYQEVAGAMDVPLDATTLPGLMLDRSMKSDPVHFNAAGYRRMAEAVVELLRQEGALL